MLNQPNRRVRTRTHGGVGGAGAVRLSPYPDKPGVSTPGLGATYPRSPEGAQAQRDRLAAHAPSGLRELVGSRPWG
jgi:hypothetical protein